MAGATRLEDTAFSGFVESKAHWTHSQREFYSSRVYDAETEQVMSWRQCPNGCYLHCLNWLSREDLVLACSASSRPNDQMKMRPWRLVADEKNRMQRVVELLNSGDQRNYYASDVSDTVRKVPT